MTLTFDAQFPSTAGNNYPEPSINRHADGINPKIHAHVLAIPIGTLLALHSLLDLLLDLRRSFLKCRMP
ncbi:MAG: hypothetical protein ABI349_14300 [Casimicrobiaceae bacterium]